MHFPHTVCHSFMIYLDMAFFADATFALEAEQFGMLCSIEFFFCLPYQ